VKCGHPCRAGPESCAKAGAQDGLHPPVAPVVSDAAPAARALPKRVETHPQ